MTSKAHASPYLYKLCLLGDSATFEAHVAKTRQSLRPSARAPASSSWGRLIRLATDKMSAMHRRASMDDAQRALPLMCAALSASHNAKVLFALRELGPSMPLSTQQACANSCAHAGKQRELEAILDMVGSSTSEAWLGSLARSAHAASHPLLAQSLDERVRALFERCELAAESPDPGPRPTPAPARRL